MTERVDVREWIEFQWPYLIAFLGGASRVEALARATGAFERVRKIGSPEVLLRLILMWAVSERSLMETAALAAEAGLADVSDVNLVKRFSRSADWLGALLAELLLDKAAALSPSLRVRLLDATSITREGSRGTDHRLHMSIDLGSSRIESVELTDGKGTESLTRFEVRAGEILIGDRGYAHRSGMAHVARGGGFFIVRSPWRVPLETPSGEAFSIFEALESIPEAEAAEFPVCFVADGERFEARLVTIRKSEPAAAQARQIALRQQTKKSQASVDVRTLEAAGYVFVLTNVPAAITSESVLQLYRLRWQIEMKFKTLKSVLHLGSVPAKTTENLRVYVFAKLLAALLIDSLIDQAESFSPWGYPIAPREPLAPHAPAV